MLGTLILFSIEIYQRHISPRKGWRCAYSTLHGGAGCSGAVQSAIRQHGWRHAAPLARQRFGECKLAAQVLRAGADVDSGPKASRKQRKRSSGVDTCCDPNWSLCADAAFDCGPGDSGCFDCSPCDCNPCN